MQRGVNRTCGYCNKIITIKDVEEENGPDMITNMPGYFHKKCKAYFYMHIVGSGKVIKELNVDKEGI